MNKITFFVPGKIKSKQRPRFSNGRVLTSKDTIYYENWVKHCFINAKNKQKFKVNMENVPIEVNIKAIFDIPKSYTKKKRQAVSEGKLLPQRKIDCDNIAKVILDSLNKIAYGDDVQVYKMQIEKEWTTEKEGVIVTIEYRL